jgi:hypothetical protein
MKVIRSFPSVNLVFARQGCQAQIPPAQESARQTYPNAPMNYSIAVEVGMPLRAAN